MKKTSTGTSFILVFVSWNSQTSFSQETDSIPKNQGRISFAIALVMPALFSVSTSIFGYERAVGDHQSFFG